MRCHRKGAVTGWLVAATCGDTNETSLFHEKAFAQWNLTGHLCSCFLGVAKRTWAVGNVFQLSAASKPNKKNTSRLLCYFSRKHFSRARTGQCPANILFQPFHLVSSRSRTVRRHGETRASNIIAGWRTRTAWSISVRFVQAFTRSFSASVLYIQYIHTHSW